MTEFPHLRLPRLDLRRLRLSPRRRLILIIGLIFAVAIGWRVLQYRGSARQAFHPASELTRIQYAAMRARSWRVSTIGTMRGVPFRTDQDVVCPYESQTTTYVGPKGSEALAEQIVVTKDVSYAREGNDPWTSQPSPPKRMCVKGPMAGPSSLTDTLQSWSRSADLRRMPDISPATSSCQWWGFYYGGSPTPMASVCVDGNSQLPLELESGPLRIQYSRWNEIGGIAPPDTGEPAPSASETPK
jgi:hypothetical protein